MKFRCISGGSFILCEEVVPKQIPGVIPGERERGSFNQGRKEAWVSLACWIWGRRTESVCRTGSERESTDSSSSQQPGNREQRARDYLNAA